MRDFTKAFLHIVCQSPFQVIYGIFEETGLLYIVNYVFA